MRMRETLAQLAADRGAIGWPGTDAGRLNEFVGDGDNPGALGAQVYLPADLPAGAPLVVVLHGCTQSAAGYDAGTGWSHLADRAGFALLFPEQRRANNPNLCFNWFQPADIAREGGEAESIAQMVTAMIARHDLDPRRVFVTGLSAGGAMTAVMLATYPEMFAGGAIIGGLPYDCARTVGQALERMAGRGGAARPQAGPAQEHWPTVSIWHGTADATVVVGNMDDLAHQWCGLHGVDARDAEVECGANWERRRWRDGGRIVVETWRIAGMGHGVPIDPAGPAGLGSVGPYMLAAGIDSTAEIAKSWDLIGDDAHAATPATAPPLAAKTAPRSAAKAPRRPTAPSRPAPPVSGIQQVIEDALRSAGLMK